MAKKSARKAKKPVEPKVEARSDEEIAAEEVSLRRHNFGF